MTASLQRAKSSTTSGLDIHANFEKLIAQTRGEVPPFQNSLGRQCVIGSSDLPRHRTLDPLNRSRFF